MPFTPPPEVIFRPLQPLTAHEREVGWPAHLCGWPLVTDDLSLMGVPGVVVIVDPDEAERMGAIVDDPLALEFTAEDMTEESVRMDWLWRGAFRVEVPRPKPHHASIRARREHAERATTLVSRQKGRPSGRKVCRTTDTTGYEDPENFRSSVVAHCRTELKATWPFVSLPALERLVAEILARDARALTPSNEQESRHTRPVRDRSIGFPALLLERMSFSELCDAAFVDAVPPGVTRKEALVRAVEYLWTREGVDWQWPAVPLPDARLLAVASIAAGEEILLRGPAPWFVARAIEAEQKAVTHTMKRVAALRLAF